MNWLIGTVWSLIGQIRAALIGQGGAALTGGDSLCPIG